ncbi:MAG: hypothetical protein U5Q44_04850 [Dehalococcoidia bacterium]|nr:hypothetical protein [Dehalococcoidia bacterium]
MTKLFKWLGGTATAALVGTLMFGAAGTFTAGEAEAQSPPSPPARFGGEVTIDGEMASAGTTISAMVDGNNCGTSSVDAGGTYVIDVPAAEPTNSPGCGTEGATVVFYVGGEQANETGEWIDFDFNRLDLTVTTDGGEEPTATPTMTATTTATDNGGGDNGGAATPTPGAPDTGSGLAAQGGAGTNAGMLFGVVLLGALAFGAAGVAAARRS